MATVTLGNIKLNWKGAYNAGTAYAIDDVVSYNGSSYVAKTATTGNLPTVTANWDIMSQAGTNGTNGTDLTSTLTTQGDIVYRDGSGLARLGYGTAGQVLKTGGSGANPSWGTVSSPIIKTYHKMFKGGQSISGLNYQSPSEISNYNLAITPTSTSSVFLATYNILIGSHADHTFIQAVAKTGSGSYSKLGTAKASMYNNVGYFDFGTFRVAANSSFATSKTHSFYYAPATTSAITFALFGGQHSNTAYFGRAQDTTTDDYTGLGMTLRVDEYASATDLVNTEYTSG